MVFTLDEVPDNVSGWGPTDMPDQYAGIPFAPYEKRTFIGRMADWSARAEQYREQRMRNRPKEVANEAFTAATEDDAGFALVDTKAAVPNQQYDKGMRGRGGRGRFGRGRGRFAAAPMGEEAKFNAKFGKKVITAPVNAFICPTHYTTPRRERLALDLLYAMRHLMCPSARLFCLRATGEQVAQEPASVIRHESME